MLTVLIKVYKKSKQSCHGGALETSFKLQDVYNRDVLDLVEALDGLGYSLKPIIQILNRRPAPRDDLIL